MIASLGAAAGLEVAGAFLNNRLALSRQHDAQGFSEQMYRNRYQMTVEDMKAAGLNPMLGYMQGAGSAPSSSAASAQGVDFGKVYNEHRLVTAQEANLTALTQKTKQDAKTSAAQEKNIDADTLIKSGMPELIAAQVVQATTSAEQSAAMAQKISAEIEKVEREIRLLEQQTEKTHSDVIVNKSVVEANRYLMGLRAAEIYLNDARARNVHFEGDILEPKAKAAKSVTGSAAAQAENIGKIGRSVFDIRFGLPKFPKKVGR